METASYVAMSRQKVLEQSMEVISNNLANATTTGFKGMQAVFQDYLQDGPDQQQVAYVRDVGTVRDTRPGDLKVTGNTYDMALEGEGYFSVSTGGGVRYSRSGSFQVTPTGGLVTADGNEILDDKGSPITLPQPIGKVGVAEDGTINVNGAPVGKLGIVKFDDPQQMVLEGSGFYRSDAQANPDPTPKVRQGMLEGSNIKSVVEMTRLLSVQGAYSDIVQVMSTEDTRLKNAIDKLSRIA